MANKVWSGPVLPHLRAQRLRHTTVRSDSVFELQVFAAFDTRVTAVVGSSPGAPIAAPYHFTSSNFYGEGPRTGGVTCVGAKWWLCSSLQYAGHPELMPMDGHGIVGMIAPRACAIATGRQDQASDMVFAGEQNIKESAKVYALLDASQYPLNIYRPGQHHGFDDITTYFDFFDHAFDRLSSYGQAMERTGVQTHASLLRWYRTYLTAAGFDWDVFNSTSTFNRTPPNRSTPIAHRIKWLLALGSDVGGELGTFSMGATYGEESEGSSYIPPMMGHTVSSGLSQQAFSFGDYLNGEIYWRNVANQNDSPIPAVIWLHPYSYNTGYSPSYGQAKMHEMLAQAGFVTMAFDQVRRSSGHLKGNCFSESAPSFDRLGLDYETIKVETDSMDSTAVMQACLDTW